MSSLDRPYTDAERKQLEVIQKLLDKASATKFPAEAETFMAKAQEMMTALSVDTATVERQSGKAQGKREEQKVDGGFYLFQRRLWKAVAELNFCMYWTQEYWKKLDKPRNYYHRGNMGVTEIRQKRHRLIGRQVNVAMTLGMAKYLEGAIERELARVTSEGDGANRSGSWANSFREGATAALVDKLAERFKRKLAEEQKRQDPARPDSGFGRAMTIADVKEVEHAGNYDFIHGEGAWARKQAREAEYAKEQAEAEAAYTAWAKANPEEAKRQQAEREKENRRYWSRYRGGRSQTKTVDASAYHMGKDAAKNISIDQQTEARKNAGLLK